MIFLIICKILVSSFMISAIYKGIAENLNKKDNLSIIILIIILLLCLFGIWGGFLI